MKRLGVLLIAVAPITWCRSTEAVRWADYWADRYGVERELVHAVIEAESAWNPRAVSRAGAAGQSLHARPPTIAPATMAVTTAVTRIGARRFLSEGASRITGDTAETARGASAIDSISARRSPTACQRRFG